LIHFLFALFFQIAFARCKPNKYGVAETPHKSIDKMGQYDRFSAAGTAFQDDFSFIVVHCRHKRIDRFQLKIF